MKTLKIFLLAGVLSGCTTTSNPWEGLEVDTSPATTPLHCVMPLPDEVVGQSIIYSSAQNLEEYRVCSEANEAIATSHALQIYQLKVARKALTEAGDAQQNISEMRLQMLEDERRHNLWTSVGYWVVIIALGVSL